MVSHLLRFSLKAAPAALLIFLLTACGIQVPADPHGTLDRVQNGVMRVGITENRPWVVVDEAAQPSGSEPELISEFARQLGSQIEWTNASEAVLLDALERGELDLVAGGFLEDTPWAEKGATTRPYVQITTPEGRDPHVMIVRAGENGFQVALEKFLHAEAGS